MPDLVVTDIVHDGPYLKKKYRNAALGATGADFLIRLEVAGNSRGGNSAYRFVVPPSHQEQSTGGLTLGLLGVERDQEITVTATIDWEGRVHETDETNNSLTKRLYIAPESPQRR